MTMRLFSGLAITVLIAGCTSANTVVIAKEELCRSWRHQTVSKDDKLTDKTAGGLEGNNNARPAWGCEWGQNRAKM